MNLADQDFHIIIALLTDKAEEQDRNAMKSTELLARQRVDMPDSPLIPDLEEQVRVFEADRDDLHRIAAEFRVGLGEPAIFVE